MQNISFTLMISVLFPNVTSEKMALTSWKLAKPLLQRTLLGVLFFGGYESARQKLLNYSNQRDNKGKLLLSLVCRHNETNTLNRSSGMPIK